MSNYSERSGPSFEFEKQVIERFNSLSGWSACPFGQGEFPAGIKDGLKNFKDTSKSPTLIRWFPDILLAFRSSGGKSYICVMDVKVDLNHDTPNHAVEKNSCETLEMFVANFRTPAFFLFSDWTVLTPTDVRQRGVNGPDENTGSGTPYFLVKKRFASPVHLELPGVPEFPENQPAEQHHDQDER